MRHTFATLALVSGADLASVQTWLGHKDIHTTMRYINLLPEHLKEQIKKIDPVNYRQTKSANFDVFSPIEVRQDSFNSYNTNVHDHDDTYEYDRGHSHTFEIELD